ncbi:class I SAM-dependent methyltransferase [Methanosphaerula palustris]|uniref:Methyltransferase type 11 n=1 Tax=Methanosphaerula palustris (strain ATCC BAA-1556 / DSM 19958 / E1-9c) TaxID=521011 RepID=B8GH68_METPE|nr:class I SAM-dependent methyltransferase [Methanosphaerula palustris]ACL16473.1 Methyltransferase type 11 [Methanosphaerula palustris E1-9c]
MTESITKFDTPVLAERYDQISDSQFDNGVQLIQELGIKKGDRILDVGCGTGRLIEHIINTFGDSVEIVGLEPSEYRIKIAQQKVTPFPNVTFQLGSDKDLHNFADNSFDIVYINSVFHHIPNVAAKAAALVYIHRILKPGGKLGISDPNKDVPGLLRDITKEVVESHGLHYKQEKLISPKSLSSLLISSGLDIVKLDKVTKTRYYPTPQDALEFSEASNFGTYLSEIPEDQRELIKSDIAEKLVHYKTEKGVEHTLGRIFVIAQKKANN